MARIIVMPDASHLMLGIRGTVLHAEQVEPKHLEDLHSSEQFLKRLKGAVREAAPPGGHEQSPTYAPPGMRRRDGSAVVRRGPAAGLPPGDEHEGDRPAPDLLVASLDPQLR
jgi:hypothetical protein